MSASDAWWRDRALSMRSFPPPVPHRMESMRGPAYSNWVIKNHVLAGPHPGAVTTSDMVKNLTQLLGAGVTTFVCLQHEMPTPHINKKKSGSTPASSRLRSAFGHGVVVHAKPYIDDAQIIAEHAGLPQASPSRPLTFLHLPIHDSKGATTDDETLMEFVVSLVAHIKAGEVLYLQCGDGDGRSGTLSALLLGLVYDLSSSEALDLTQRCRNSRAGTEGHSPDTHEQKMQVHRILGNAGFRAKAKAVPGRSSMEAVRNPEKNLHDVLDNIRDQLSARGTSAFTAMRAYMRSLGKASLSLFDLNRAMQDQRLVLTDDEAGFLVRAYSHGGGGMDLEQFLLAVRGSMNDMRSSLVKQAFDTLTANSPTGVLDLNLIAKLYTGSQHPDVKAGRRTLSEVVAEFLASFKVRSNSEGRVELSDFMEFYADISPAVDDDNYFQLMMWNSWPFSHRPVPGEAAAAGDPFSPAAVSAPVDPAVAFVTARAKLERVGDMAVARLKQALFDHDADRDGWVQEPEFVAACASAKLNWQPPLVSALFIASRPQRGSVHIPAFVSTLTGRLSPFRRKLVLAAFRKLDVDGNSTLSLPEVQAAFNADRHPAVLASRARPEDVYRDFLTSFSEGMESGVTLPQFEAFYEGVSACVPDDDAFQMLMWNTWSLGSAAKPRGSRPVATPESAYSRARDGDEGLFGAMDRLRSHERPTPGAGAGRSVSRTLFGESASPTRGSTSRVRSELVPSPSRAAKGVRPPPIPDDLATKFGRDRGKRLDVSARGQLYTTSGGVPLDQGGSEVDKLRAQFMKHAGVSTPGSSGRGSVGPATPDKLTSNIRSACAKHGVRGVVKLERRLMNAGRGNPLIDNRVFVHTLREAAFPLGPADYERLVGHYDPRGQGYVDARAFLSDVKGELTGMRADLVRTAFAQMDPGTGVVDLDAIRMKFNAKAHPDVKSGRRSEAEVLREFLETCDIGRDGKVDLAEFMAYYAAVSATVDDDNYFQLLVWNTWDLKSQRGPGAGGAFVNPLSPTRPKVTPAGVSATATTEYHLTGAGMSPAPAVKVYGLPPTRQTASSAGVSGVDLPGVLERLRATFARRGVDGILDLGRSFKVIDRSRSGFLTMKQLSEALHSYGVTLSDSETQVVFDHFDRDGNARISFQEFIRGFRGPLPAARLDLIHQAFRKMDVDGSGVIDITDIALSYNPRVSAAVKSGAKSERDALRDFLSEFDSFEADGRVTVEEFEDYYANISAAIEDDSYFQLLMWNTWQLDKPNPRAR